MPLCIVLPFVSYGVAQLRAICGTCQCVCVYVYVCVCVLMLWNHLVLECVGLLPSVASVLHSVIVSGVVVSCNCGSVLYSVCVRARARRHVRVCVVVYCAACCTIVCGVLRDALLLRLDLVFVIDCDVLLCCIVSCLVCLLFLSIVGVLVLSIVVGVCLCVCLTACVVARV